ncbi:diguanylate cyclase [Acidovorax sp. SUPP2825]|uniref:sensor domain-containing diguanylate cyclase n=1 Tax=Acidovorax sp. SUPP2825 TaxID=2920879 RepID=UPI0023DE25DD|nr:diguanylate cyclase [Acidovorax sp. SUPP2825]GKS94386.1 diguanylate cyclase [Acidovorax sp. SUPP2825]
MTPPSHEALEAEQDAAGDTPGWLLPGRLVQRLMLVAVLAVVFAGAMAAWTVSRAAGEEAMRRLVSQQTDEVEVVARLLASKIEQSQKVLSTVAEGIQPVMLDSPSSLGWLLQQGLPAVRFFDAMQVVRQDGTVAINLQYGRLDSGSSLDPAERDSLRRTMLEGKPLVSGLIGGRPSEARVMFTIPLHRDEGTVVGAVSGVLRLQSQGLLPPSMSLPARKESRLIVFTRDGTILSHPDPARVMGSVRDEAGLSQVFARSGDKDQPVMGRGFTERLPGHVVSLAGMPMTQWTVARVNDAQALLAPLEGAQRRAAWLAAALIGAAALLAVACMAWLAQPLARLCHRAAHLGARAPGAREDMPWPQGAGEVDGLVAACRGLLDERASTQSQMGLLRGQLQSILDHAPTGIIITRGENLQVVSLQAGRMLGYEPAQLQGRLARALYVSDAEYEHLKRRVRAEFSAHGTFDGDVCFLRQDGSAVWARVLGRSVRDALGDAGTVWMLEDLTAAREARRRENWAGGLDALTQLANRDAFSQRLHALLADRAARPDTVQAHPGGEVGEGVVLFLDLDHFTVVNAIAGHDAGDDVLRHVGRLIETQVRSVGWAARLGGDEFAVVLPGCPLGRGLAIAEQLCAAVRAWEPSYQGRSYTLGVSIGLVPLDSGVYDVTAVLHAADMACYEAKRAGRDRVEVRSVRGGRAQVRAA